MAAITIMLTEDCLSKLKEKARHLGLSPEDLVRASIEELLARPDEAFQKVVGDVLTKNVELYRRLV